jgi:DNA polymerase III subunit delta'
LVRIRSFTDQEIAQTLVSRKNAAPRRAAQIAYLAEGNLNEAMRLNAEVKNDQHESFGNWMRLCFQLEKKLPELVKTTEKLATMPRESQKNLLHYGINIVRESLLYTFQEPSLVRLEGDEMTFVQGFSKIMTEQKAERFYAYFSDAVFHLERNVNPRIVFLDTSLQIAGAIKAG